MTACPYVNPTRYAPALDDWNLALICPGAFAARCGAPVAAFLRCQMTSGFPVAFRLGSDSVAFVEADVQTWFSTKTARPQSVSA